MSQVISQEVERQSMDVDVLVIGGGCAGLSTAVHLQNLIKRHNEDIASGKKSGVAIADQNIVVLEKGAEIGAHSFSGAVLDPIALREMIPDYIEQGCPIECDVRDEAVYYLAKNFQVKSPVVPPPFHNLGNHTISLSKFNRWLGKLAEERGVNIFPGFAAVECLYNERGQVIGVRTGDKGLDKNGKPKSNFEPGMLLKSKITIFAEGPRGSLFKQVEQKLGLRRDSHPDVFEEGVKEIIQVPPGQIKPGMVIHTLGFPLKETIGGTFIYTLPGDKIIIGLVGYLDTKDPLFDPHRELQKLKTHPFIYNMIKGGKVLAYGGKTLPAGGWYSIPKLYHDGMMVCGDTASLVDVQRLKGIHLAMKSGMCAAETCLEAILKNDFSSETLKAYESRVHNSFIKEQLYKVRNFHQTLSQGLLASLPQIALQEITGGRGLVDEMPVEKDAFTTEPSVEIWGSEGLNHPDNQIPKPDGKLFFDKLSSVYLTGTRHDEDSPNHLKLRDGNVCSDICAPKFKSPCNHFCPANVYEMVPDEKKQGRTKLMINFTNCIHCKTCDIKCPMENIDWTTPEGGGGPNYTET